MPCVCRDEVLLPTAASLGLADASKAVAAAVEVYKQVFEEETNAAAPETAVAAAARRQRLRAWRAALGLTAADVAALHADAYRVSPLLVNFNHPPLTHARKWLLPLLVLLLPPLPLHPELSRAGVLCMQACTRF